MPFDTRIRICYSEHPEVFYAHNTTLDSIADNTLVPERRGTGTRVLDMVCLDGPLAKSDVP